MDIATQDAVDRDELDAFLADRRRYVLITARSDGRPQVSPVAGAIAGDGRVLISSYPGRAKVKNLQRDADCAVLVLSDDFDGPWVQVYGTARVITGEDGVDALVDYYRAAAGEHDDWDEYRRHMRDRDKVCIAITVTDWGPIATGGVPPEFADD
ncbi:PPOX class F420-dependent oxidoreductase [soil metagenome]